MRLAFVQNIWEELQGPLVLAEILEREGHEVRFFMEGPGWTGRLASWRPEVVAMSATTGNHSRLLDLAGRARSRLGPDVPIVVGGPHATFFPDVIAHPAVDAVCRGEAETALPGLLASMEGRRLPTDAMGFWVKRDGEIHRNAVADPVGDLDRIPIPRRSMYREHAFFRDFPVKRVIAGRGCPFSCSYCFNHSYRKLVDGRGPYVRRRSVGHVMEEIEYLKRSFPLSIVEFDDDAFTLDRDWVLEFAHEYGRRIRLPYFVLVHPAHVDDGIAEALAASGCKRAMFGIESGNPAIRREVMNRAVDDGQIRACASALSRHGIPFQTFNMVGLPGETLEDAFETVRLNREVGPLFAWCSIAQPYPGTRLAEICTERGLLTGGPGEDRRFSASYFDATVMDLPAARAMENLQKFFGLLVRFPWIEPLVRLLIGFPPNAAFRLAHQFWYGYHVKARNGLGWIQALRLYSKHARHYS